MNAPHQDGLPAPGSQAASDAIDAELKAYAYPANPKNAARAGWNAARKMLAARPLPALAEFDEWQRNAPRELPERFSAVLRNALAARPLPAQAKKLDRAFQQAWSGGAVAAMDNLEGREHKAFKAKVREKYLEALAAHPKAEPAPKADPRECPHCMYRGPCHCGDVAALGGTPGHCSNASAYGLRATPSAKEPT